MRVHQTPQDHADMVTEVLLQRTVAGHPNVTNLHDMFETPAIFYVVMELVRGGDVMKRITQLEHFSEHVAVRLELGRH